MKKILRFRRLFSLLLVLILMSTFFAGVAGSQPPPPTAPSNLNAVAQSGTQVLLTWQDNSNNEQGFRVERGRDGVNFTGIATVGSNITAYTDSSGLEPATTYYYRVRAYKANTFSDYTSTSVTTLGAMSIPNAPTNLSATTVSTSRIDLTWTDNSNNETGFRIERKTGTGSYAQIATVGANVTSFSNTSLASNTQYTYRVLAYNAAGNSLYSNEATAATGIIPAAPTNLSATTVSTSRIDLTWTDNANNETGFRIERKLGTGSFTEIATVGANVTSYANTGLTSNREYTYRVRAYNATGNSAYSNEAKATTGTLPAAPSNLRATTVSASRIDLVWTDNANNETGFRIERKLGTGSFTEIATVGANVTTYTNTGLTENREYTYRVRAYNTAGNSAYSNEAKATTGTLPAAPSNLVATTVSASRIDLSWTDNANNETGFRIERKLGTGSFTEIATVGANVTSYTNTGLTNNREYTYRMRAYNAVGNSAYSNEAKATTGNLPAAPTNLSATATSSNRIVLNWTDRSDNESGFRIERRRGTGSYTQIATVAANTATYTDTNVDPETRYTYRVWAYNAVGNSAYSNEASATTPQQVITQIKLRVGQTSYQVNGRTLVMDTAPIIVENRTLLPIRFIAEALGATVEWNERELKATIILENNRIELWVNSNSARVNGVYQLIDSGNPQVVPMIVPPGRTMMPLRFISEALGCRVDWNAQTREITVTYPAP